MFGSLRAPPFEGIMVQRNNVSMLEQDGTELGVPTELDLTKYVEQNISMNPFTSVHCGEVKTDRIYDIYDSAGGQTITASAITIALNTVRSLSDTYSFNNSSGELEFITANQCWVSYRVSADDTSNSRSVTRCFMEIDTGSGFSEVAGSRTYLYNRTTTAGENSAHAMMLIDADAGDKVRVRASRETGSNNITIADGSSLSIFPVFPNRQTTNLEVDCGDVNGDYHVYTDCGEL